MTCSKSCTRFLYCTEYKTQKTQTLIKVGFQRECKNEISILIVCSDWC